MLYCHRKRQAALQPRIPRCRRLANQTANYRVALKLVSNWDVVEGNYSQAIEISNS
jgi:hypothetical protein